MQPVLEQPRVEDRLPDGFCALTFLVREIVPGILSAMLLTSCLCRGWWSEAVTLLDNLVVPGCFDKTHESDFQTPLTRQLRTLEAWRAYINAIRFHPPSLRVITLSIVERDSWLDLSDDARERAKAIGELVFPWLLKNRLHFPATRSLTVIYGRGHVSPSLMSVLSLVPQSGVRDLTVALNDFTTPVLLSDLEKVLHDGGLRAFSIESFHRSARPLSRVVDLVSHTPAAKSPRCLSVKIRPLDVEGLQLHVAGVVNALTDAHATHMVRDLTLLSIAGQPDRESDIAADLWRLTMIPSLVDPTVERPCSPAPSRGCSEGLPSQPHAVRRSPFAQAGYAWVT